MTVPFQDNTSKFGPTNTPYLRVTSALAFTWHHQFPFESFEAVDLGCDRTIPNSVFFNQHPSVSSAFTTLTTITNFRAHTEVLWMSQCRSSCPPERKQVLG